MFLDNKALLDQLMGADRNKSSFQGIREQWKESTVCKPYLLDFCPMELFNNTKLFMGHCSKTHSDVMREQYSNSSDPAKPSLMRKYELDLLDQLERIVDSVEVRVRKQTDRINASVPEFKLREEKEHEIRHLNHQMSVSMKEVERLAEAGLFEQSQILMEKISELQSRVKELSTNTQAQFIKQEVVCHICGVLIGTGIEERTHDHIRGKQHLGMERIRLKINEIKTKYKLNKKKRDLDFTPSIEIEQELKREGVELVVPTEVVVDEIDVQRDRSRSRQRRRSPRQEPKPRALSPKPQKPSRSISPMSVSEDEFGRRRRRPRRSPPRRQRSPPRRPRSPLRSKSMDSVGSPKSLASVNPEEFV
jgi:hypothetical protein